MDYGVDSFRAKIEERNRFIVFESTIQYNATDYRATLTL